MIDIFFRPITNLISNGFNATYYSTRTGCGANLNEPNGAFTSPGYPSYYGENETCRWKIIVNQDKIINLKFITFDVGSSTKPETCSDNVAVYNGETNQSPLLGELCGSDIPALVESTGNSMTVHLESMQGKRSKGFLAMYQVYTVVPCSRLNVLENGHLKPNIHSVNYKSVVNYTCDTGYSLVGNRQRTCQKDGTWSGQEPLCQVVSCSNLNAPANGQLKPNTHSAHYQSVVNYECDSSYTLVGHQQRTCQEDGAWSGQEPYCQDSITAVKEDSTPLTMHESGKPSDIIIITVSVLGTLLFLALLVIAALCRMSNITIVNKTSDTENQRCQIEDVNDYAFIPDFIPRRESALPSVPTATVATITHSTSTEMQFAEPPSTHSNVNTENQLMAQTNLPQTDGMAANDTSDILDPSDQLLASEILDQRISEHGSSSEDEVDIVDETMNEDDEMQEQGKPENNYEGLDKTTMEADNISRHSDEIPHTLTDEHLSTEGAFEGAVGGVLMASSSERLDQKEYTSSTQSIDEVTVNEDDNSSIRSAETLTTLLDGQPRSESPLKVGAIGGERSENTSEKLDRQVAGGIVTRCEEPE